MAHLIPTGHHYSDVQLIGANTVVAIGVDGTFIRSEDGGTFWKYYYIPTESLLNSMYFVNSDTGFVVGLNYCNYPKVFKTTTGGQSWDTLFIPTNESFNDIKFLNKDTGWFAGTNGSI